jgi:RNA polymerase sigma factor (sigma-70 family)
MRNPKGRPGRKPSGKITSRTADAGGTAAGGGLAAAGDAGGQARAPGAEPGAGQAALMDEMAPLYQEHYRSLVRLAALLVSDLAAAEEIVQEAFADAHGRWSTLPDQDAALRYLRQSLVRRARTMTQFQSASDPRAAGLPASGREAIVLAALRALPARQREVLVLRYFADLPESEIASVTGTRIAVIRSYATRGMSSLRTGLPGNVA